MKKNIHHHVPFLSNSGIRLGLILLMCFILTNLNAQQKDITGTVSDESGTTLPGVSVIIKGTSTGVQTDFDGKFSIKASPDQTLTFSYLGMKAVSILVGSKTKIDVTLEEDAATLDEIVVVGYGSRKKSDLIASVTSIEPTEMTKVATSDVGQMLRGKAAGVQISLNDAGPNGSSSITIRGTNSLSGNPGAFIIVDGVPVGALNDINPNDIESLEILKDAAATAIYGSRGANGVILITTKRGKQGKTSISYRGDVGVQNYNRNFDIYSGDEFAQLKREAFRTSNLGVYVPDEQIFSALELESVQNQDYINWEDLILGTGVTHNHNLSISTASEKTKVYSSFNIFNQDGIIANSFSNRVTFRFNIDQKINDWLKIGANTSLQYSRENSPNVGAILLTSITTSPLGKVYNDDGSLRFLPGGFEENKNPLIDLTETETINDSRNDILNIFADVSPFKGFNYRFNASRRSWNSRNRSYNTSNSITGVTNGSVGSGFIQFQDNVQWQIQNVFTYKPTFTSEKHNLDLTAVHEVSENKYNFFQNSASQIPNDILGINGLQSALVNNPSIGASRNSILGFVGRAEYGYDSRYYISLSARADAASVFGENNKWGYFPAAGLSWNAHNESFLKEVKEINKLKFSVTYGQVGNSAIGPSQTLTSGLIRDYIINGQQVSGAIPGSQLANPDLKWETTTTLNAKLDFGLFSNRISGTFEYYDGRTTDLLQDESLPPLLGYTFQKVNLGELQNSGIEANLNFGVIRKEDFNVDLGFIFTRNRNKLLSLGGADEDGDGIEDDNIGNGWFIGKSIFNYYQFVGIGIFQEGEDIINSAQPAAMPGDVKLLDVNGDGVIDADNDRVYTDRNPDWFGSINLSANYKGLDFSADLNFVEGVTRYNTFLVGYTEGGSLRGIKNGIKQDYWLPSNPGGNFPRPSEANDPQNLFAMGLQDASYMRLQNITMGYTLPQYVLESFGLSKLRLYVTGTNLITITDYESFSPELSPTSYPEPVTIVAGLQLGF